MFIESFVLFPADTFKMVGSGRMIGQAIRTISPQIGGPRLVETVVTVLLGERRREGE
jgi:hypothetical protein